VVSVTIEPALADLEYEAQTDDLTRLAKVALIVAAQRRTTLTVGELVPPSASTATSFVRSSTWYLGSSPTSAWPAGCRCFPRW